MHEKHGLHIRILQRTLQAGIENQKAKVLPAPMAHRAAPISVSVALGHTSANAFTPRAPL